MNEELGSGTAEPQPFGHAGHRLCCSCSVCAQLPEHFLESSWFSHVQSLTGGKKTQAPHVNMNAFY